MKTIHHSKPAVRRAFGMLVLLGILLGSPISTRAQERGECTEQVLSAPTESSVKVRLRGVSRWPANPICVWRFSGVRADGKNYTWNAVLVGDGILEDSETHLTTVNVAVVFRYEERSGTESAEAEANLAIALPPSSDN